MFTLTPTQHTDLAARVAAALSEGRAERAKRAARTARLTAIRCNSRDTADLGDDLADLGEALKFAAVPGGLTAMRRDYSGAAYAERGRTTVRLAPAKAAANRSARRSAREALRRALDRNGVQDAARRVKRPFRYAAPDSPVRLAAYEASGERRRRRVATVDAYYASVEVWEQRVAAISQADGYRAASDWKTANPRPAYPAYER